MNKHMKVKHILNSIHGRSSAVRIFLLMVLMTMAVLVTACAKDTQGVLPPDTAGPNDNAGIIEPAPSAPEDTNEGSDPGETPADSNAGEGNAANPTPPPSEPVVSPDPQGPAEPDAFSDVHSVSVLVNKEYALPEDYEPADLVYPDVRFTFKEKIEKRMMRSEAAAALEKMFSGAEEDGIYLAGVSAYRSHSTQTSLFNRYVKRDGLEKAKTYSAVPGHSEHETGLAIDVSGSDGKCAAEDCFGETKEAAWLAKHAPEYGFIIRYPEGKEDITGYKYEPWHLRFVGVEIARDIAERGITLEEYYNAVPVSSGS